MTPETNRLWKNLVFTLLATSVLIFVIGYMGLTASYFNSHPRHPDPTMGRIYPYNYHEIVVYQTRAEQRLLDIFAYSPFVLFGGAFLIAVVKLKMKIELRPPA